MSWVACAWRLPWAFCVGPSQASAQAPADGQHTTDRSLQLKPLRGGRSAAMVKKQRLGTGLLRLALIVLVLVPAQALAASPGTWVITGSMNAPRAEQAATLLPDGKVLVEGGAGALAELYNPSTGTWAPTGNMTTN